MKRALASILSSKYDNLEIIVVDDHSSEDNASVVIPFQKQIPLVYLYNESNLYAEKSRRLGFEKAKGQYVVFCDDDDYYFDDNFFSQAVAMMEENPSLAFVSGNAFIFFESSGETHEHVLNVSGKMNGLLYLKSFQTGFDKPLSTFTTIFQRVALESEYVYFNDSSLYMSALLWGDAYIMKEVVGCYCIHDVNISSSIPQRFILEVLESKYQISKALELRIAKSAKKWWTDQLILTSNYYFRSKCVTVIGILKYCSAVHARYSYEQLRFTMFCLISCLKKGFRR